MASEALSGPLSVPQTKAIQAREIGIQSKVRGTGRVELTPMQGE